MLTSSLQDAIVSFISAFTAVWNIKGKLKEKLKYVCYLLFRNLTPNAFILARDFMNANVASKIPLYLQNVYCNKFKRTWLDNKQIHIS